MADPRGTRASLPAAPDGLLFAAGRMIGFVALAGLAMATAAVLVLLPAYARMRLAIYERDCDRVTVAELQATAAANARLIADLPTNPVLTKRLAMSQGDLLPDNEVIVFKGSSPSPRPPPDVIIPIRYGRPAPPDGWMIRAAAKVQHPPTRRGLLLLATGALLVALFLFAPPEKYDRRSAAAGDSWLVGGAYRDNVQAAVRHSHQRGAWSASAAAAAPARKPSHSAQGKHSHGSRFGEPDRHGSRGGRG